MCTRTIPLYLSLLHALRLEAHANSDALATQWMALNGLDGACAPVRALAELLSDQGHVAPPGNPSPWPHEQAVLEALARVEREPGQAENLLTFLPPAKRAAGMALLAELSRCISEDLASRLRGLGWNPKYRTANCADIVGTQRRSRPDP